MDSIRLSKLIAPAFYSVHEDIKRGAHAEYWLKGGRGSGKSTFIAIEIILGLLRDREANAIVYRKVANTLKDSVYEQLNWAIDAMGIAYHFRRKLSPIEIVLRATGQRIVFRGADDPMKSKSIKLSSGYFKYLWFEELTEFAGMDAVRVIKQSIIRGAEKAHTFYSYNPPRMFRDWTNSESLRVKPDRLVHHSCYTDMPKKWLGAAFLAEAEALRASNERAYRHAYLGEVTGTGGQVFDNLTIREIKNEEISLFDRTYNGLDFGFAVDPCALIKVIFDRRCNVLYVVDEYFAVRASNFTLAAECLQMCASRVILCDSADPRTISELRSRGVNAVAARKGPDSVRYSINWLQDLREIVVDPARCPNAAREFSGYEYQQDKFGNFRADFPDKDNHVIDAVRYAVSEIAEDRVAKTVPGIRRYI